MTATEVIKGQYIVSLNGSGMKERLKKTYLEDGRFSETEIKELNIATPYELFEKWLDYEGIQDYSMAIIKALRESGFVVEPVERED